MEKITSKKPTKKQIAERTGLKLNEFKLIEELGLPFIHSKLYVGSYWHFGTDWEEKFKEAIEHQRETYKKFLDEKKYARYVFSHPRPYRFQAFIEVHYKMDFKEAAELCGEVWIDAENPGINIGVWKGLFKKYGEAMMDKEDLEKWNSLPDVFEVWHGDEGEHDGMVSWTLSKEVAQFFANRFTQNPRAVTKKTVKKSDCLCYFGGRDEEEIIIL